MNHNRLLIALVVLLGLTGAVVATMRSHESETTVEKPNVTLPTLKKEDISSVEITNPAQGRGSVTLTKQGDSWSVTAPLAAKADQGAVDAVLEKLSDLQVTGVAASRKENYARLEVDDAHAIHVVAKGGDKVLADLYLGAAKGGGTMVRVAGQEPVLAVRGSLRYAFDKEVRMFRDRVITDVDPKDVTGFSLGSAKGTFKFERAAQEGSKWAQVKGEKPIQRFSDAKVLGLVTSLARLRATDFAEPTATADGTGVTKPAATAVLTKADGTRLTLELGNAQPNDYFLRLVGNDVIFRIPKYSGDRMIADAAEFQEPEKKEGAAAAPAPTAPDMGGQQIPPELLQQLQQQLGHGGGPH